MINIKAIATATDGSDGAGTAGRGHRQGSCFCSGRCSSAPDAAAGGRASVRFSRPVDGAVRRLLGEAGHESQNL